MWLDKFMPRFYLLALLTTWKSWSGFKTVFWSIQVVRQNDAIWYCMKQQARERQRPERGRGQRVETGWGKFPNFLSPIRKGISDDGFLGDWEKEIERQWLVCGFIVFKYSLSKFLYGLIDFSLSLCLWNTKIEPFTCLKKALTQAWESHQNLVL